MSKVIKTDSQWLQQLGDTAFNICRKKGTERAFTGEYWDCKGTGVYVCRCCDKTLFDSTTKYDSGSGWPSFYQPIDEHSVATESDDSLAMQRVEVICSQCDSHLGHVFTDGPQPTGLRYCVNSTSLKFIPNEVVEK